MDDLRKPLLDDEFVNSGTELDVTHHDREPHDDESDVRAVWFLCSVQMDDNEEETKRPQSFCSKLGSFVFASLLPILLYIQFYTVTHMSSMYDTLSSNWNTVQLSILLFVITTILYRQSTHLGAKEDEKSYCSMMLYLLPDLMIDFLLLLVLLRMMNAAVMTMQICTIFLAVCSILNSCTCSFRITTDPLSSTLYEDEEDLDGLHKCGSYPDNDLTLAVVL